MHKKTGRKNPACNVYNWIVGFSVSTLLKTLSLQLLIYRNCRQLRVLIRIAVGQCLLHFIYFKEFFNYGFCFFKV